MSDSKPQRGCEIEVTPEMIEAGDAEMIFYDGAYESDRGRAEVLRRIYVAMCRAAKSRPRASASGQGRSQDRW